MTDAETSQWAIKWILERLGSLRDLQDEVAAVVWVTLCRCFRGWHKLGEGGGEKGLLRNMILGYSDLMIRTQQAAFRLDFLQNIIATIRSNPSKSSRFGGRSASYRHTQMGDDRRKQRCPVCFACGRVVSTGRPAAIAQSRKKFWPERSPLIGTRREQEVQAVVSFL
jgi:hypothetical protein